MQATQETERTYHVRVEMGSKSYRTKQEYTRAQAEEINHIAIESARSARGDDSGIVPKSVELVKRLHLPAAAPKDPIPTA